MTDRREQIVRAARELVAEQGIDALSVRNTAARAGIGASTLRHYFPTQQALYDATISASFNAMLEDLRIADPQVPPGDRLLECLLQFLPPTEAQVHTLLDWLNMYAAALGPERTEQGGRALASLSELGRQRVIRWLEVLRTEGRLRPGDPAGHASLLMVHLDGLCLALLTPGSDTTLARAREQLGAVIRAMVVR